MRSSVVAPWHSALWVRRPSEKCLLVQFGHRHRHRSMRMAASRSAAQALVGQGFLLAGDAAGYITRAQALTVFP